MVAEPIRRRERKKLDADALCAVLEEGGAVARRLSVYERRDAQLDLVRLIVRAFNDDALAAAEAGTGVGKSLAYLLPAIEFALANDERIVISTATITLQQQLFEKDIPLVLSALGKQLGCALIKGRGNYLCRRRLTEELLEPPLDNAEYEELRSLTAWAETTKNGSRSDLSFLPSAGLWSRICCESDTCLGMHCAERERCFFMALRRESADARILVVNHHLLFADLAARHEGAGYESAVVLPPYTRVIIDEAHTIENAATSFFSRGWSRMGINRALGRLYRKRRTLESGLLLRLAAMLPALPDGAGTSAGGGSPGKSAFSGIFSGIPKAVTNLREAAEKADAAALTLCGGEGIYRFMPGKGADVLTELRQPLEELRRALVSLSGKVQDLLEAANQLAPSEESREDPTAWEVRAILRRLESAGASCGAFLEFGISPGLDGEVFWLEKQHGKDPWAAFTITPVNIAPLLKEALFDANKTVICVSATLGTGSAAPETGGNESGFIPAAGTVFRFWAERTGAALARGDREFLRGIFPSPFPFESRSMLLVPSDAPLPDSPDYQAFVGHAILELVRISGGSALVLFTSYQSLRAAYEEAAPALEADGIRCLKQGGDDRSRLLQQFLEDKTSVLFGTDSFWEGVDAPGETLRLVILCRLPFRTLKDPVFEARREALEKQGRNAFAELSLPDAVMKFKQGFGRLMRSSSDYGAVAVLDGRLIHKYYGRAFLGSLPQTRTSFKDFPGLAEDFERFLY
ncbi:helicase [Spirochaetia bacterium]|nr:helicase [Spirochaetia bacterium]